MVALGVGGTNNVTKTTDDIAALLGVSVSVDYLADQVTDAKNRPEAVRNVMTKNVNLWGMRRRHRFWTMRG